MAALRKAPTSARGLKIESLMMLAVDELMITDAVYSDSVKRRVREWLAKEKREMHARMNQVRQVAA